MSPTGSRRKDAFMRTREVARSRQNKHLRARFPSTSSLGPFEDLFYVIGLRGSACTNNDRNRTGTRHGFLLPAAAHAREDARMIDRSIDPLSGILFRLFICGNSVTRI